MAGQIERTWAEGSISVGGGPSSLGYAGAPGSAMSSTGTTISRSSAFFCPASTIRHSRFGPTRNCPIRSNGLWVADNPIRWISSPPALLTWLSSRSSVRAKCDPRLVWATAWISSTITASTPVRMSLTEELSIR